MSYFCDLFSGLNFLERRESNSPMGPRLCVGTRFLWLTRGNPQAWPLFIFWRTFLLDLGQTHLRSVKAEFGRGNSLPSQRESSRYLWVRKNSKLLVSRFQNPILETLVAAFAFLIALRYACERSLHSRYSRGWNLVALLSRYALRQVLECSWF